MNFVVNPYRPFTDSVEGIARAVREIQGTSRLKFTALASNPNLIRETTVDVVVTGHCLVEEAAKTLGLPVAFVSLRADLAAQLASDTFRQPTMSLRADLAAQLASDTFRQPTMSLRRFFVMPWEHVEGDLTQ
jgi:hypothetical protein